MMEDVRAILKETYVEIDPTLLDFFVGCIQDELDSQRGFIDSECWHVLEEYSQNYGLISSEDEFSALKSKLTDSLFSSGLITEKEELECYPSGTKCQAYYQDENKWYDCVILEVTIPFTEYELFYMGYEEESVILRREHLRPLPEKLSEDFEFKQPSRKLENPLVKFELEEVPEWLLNQLNADLEEDDELPPGACPMCERIMPLTFHHLRPRTMHDKYIKMGFTKEELNSGVDLCRPCHSAVHSTYSNDMLAKSFYTLELLMQDESILKWIKYISKQRRTKHMGSDVSRILKS